VFSFAASLVVTAVMVGIAILVARRRPPGTPLTWGEAFVAATFVFALMLMIYGIVPDRWMRWCDSELRWRSDAYGVPLGPFAHIGPWHFGNKGRLWAGGITFFGRGRIMLSLQAVRDLIATVIYLVGLGGQIAGWLWWQNRGKKKDVPELETSKYGRPLLRKV
jgi:hypothetical protein